MKEKELHFKLKKEIKEINDFYWKNERLFKNLNEDIPDEIKNNIYQRYSTSFKKYITENFNIEIEEKIENRSGNIITWLRYKDETLLILNNNIIRINNFDKNLFNNLQYKNISIQIKEKINAIDDNIKLKNKNKKIWEYSNQINDKMLNYFERIIKNNLISPEFEFSIDDRTIWINYKKTIVLYLNLKKINSIIKRIENIEILGKKQSWNLKYAINNFNKIINYINKYAPTWVNINKEFPSLFE